MSIEFVGTITTQHSLHVDPSQGSVLDLGYLRRITIAHEEAGFNKVLVPFVHTLPDTFLVAQYAANHTTSLEFVLAHRAGFVAPTLAARAFATLDHMTAGRIALHLVTGGSDASQRRDGDYLDKAGRYRRSAEYLEILEELWQAGEPISHAGEFYRFEDAWSLLRPVDGRLEVYFGGASTDAQQVAAAHADTMILWGEPLAGVKEQIAAIQGQAARIGRIKPIRFFLAVRPILAETDEQAWSQAYKILELLMADGTGSVVHQPSAGFTRLLAAAAAKDIHDRALWTAPARVPGAHGNATALVGSPETVVSALMDYVRVGITGFVINGYNPVHDAVDYGRHIIPDVRSAVVEH